MNVLDILTGSDWNAEPWYYDFLCTIEFHKDGTGTMKFGGGQVLRLAVDFRFKIIDGDRIRFEFFSTNKGGFFTNANFKRTDLNAFRSVEFEVQEGPFLVDEPYIGQKEYKYLLKFNLSPFPIDTDVERQIAGFYGWEEKRE